MEDKILLSHGDGGYHTYKLIQDVFSSYLYNPKSISLDSYIFNNANKLAFTTDSFVVKPLFFRGGDIGKLSICGTINDLATVGASPLYISAGFVIEEGFSINDLKRIVKSMKEICDKTGAQIITGDTKVVEKGSIDGLYINTSGIGQVSEHFSYQNLELGDEIIITGGIAEHGSAIMLDRLAMEFTTDLISDCTPLNNIINILGEDIKYVKLMKDPTRGGLATVLNEIAASEKVCIEIIEQSLPIKDKVKAINNILGIDPLYLASEGRMVILIKGGYGDRILKLLNNNGFDEAVLLGSIVVGGSSMVYLITGIGTKRIIPMLEGKMLPRIC